MLILLFVLIVSIYIKKEGIVCVSTNLVFGSGSYGVTSVWLVKKNENNIISSAVFKCPLHS